WPYATQNGIVRLWLGSVHEITVKNYIYFFSLIANSGDYNKGLQLFRNLDLAQKVVTTHPQQPQAQIKLKHPWDGKVILIEATHDSTRAMNSLTPVD
ncbi:MAG TPA: hypothetical protein DCZ03_09370, partial [Gammaproteobacteria bacterium]|nr:hypothetical protein [Gammaproteobacteria bacterium]